jgi:hypothetical protein
MQKNQQAAFSPEPNRTGFNSPPEDNGSESDIKVFFYCSFHLSAKLTLKLDNVDLDSQYFPSENDPAISQFATDHDIDIALTEKEQSHYTLHTIRS